MVLDAHHFAPGQLSSDPCPENWGAAWPKAGSSATSKSRTGNLSPAAWFVGIPSQRLIVLPQANLAGDSPFALRDMGRVAFRQSPFGHQHSNDLLPFG